MYLRAARRRKDGKLHVYWQLVRSVRQGRKVRQQVVAHLGELDAAGQAQAKAVAESITGRGGGSRQADLFAERTEAAQPVPVRLDPGEAGTWARLRSGVARVAALAGAEV